MRFAFWVLLAFIAWFYVGAFIGLNDEYAIIIKEMSNYLILDWLLQKSAESPLVLGWFIGLCILGALLAVSFLFCSYYNLLKLAKKNHKKGSVLLLFIHLMFVAIMALHLASMLFGYKYSNVGLTTDNNFQFEDGYTLKLDSVHYVDEIEILKLKYKERRNYMTSDALHYKQNIAFVSLYQNGELLKNGQTTMLHPFEYGTLRLSISFFYIPKNSETNTPGIRVVIMKNDLMELFFISYILCILSILWFLAITWKKKL
jgi:hypothetical protein